MSAATSETAMSVNLKLYLTSLNNVIIKIKLDAKMGDTKQARILFNSLQVESQPFTWMDSSAIPGVAMEHYKALYSTVAPYHGSLAT